MPDRLRHRDMFSVLRSGLSVSKLIFRAGFLTARKLGGYPLPVHVLILVFLLGFFAYLGIERADSLEALADAPTEHVSEITALSFSGNGTLLAGAGQHGEVRVWDLFRFEPYFSGESETWISETRKAIPAHEGRITRLVPWGDYSFLSLGVDKRLRSWLAGEVISEAVAGAALAVARNRIAADIREAPIGRVRVWPADDWQNFKDYTTDFSTVCALALSPDGRELAVSGGPGELSIHELATGRVAKLAGSGAVRALFYSDAGLVSVDRENEIIIWDTWNKASPDVKNRKPFKGPFRAAELSSDGFLFVVGAPQEPVGFDAASCVIEVSLPDLKIARTHPTTHKSCITSLAIDPFVHNFATGGEDGRVEIRPLSESGIHKSVESMSGPPDPVSSLAASTDGEWLATSSDNSHYVAIHSLLTGKLENLFNVPCKVRKLVALPDGRRLLLVSDIGRIVVIDRQTGTALPPPPDTGESISHVAISPSGNLLALANDDMISLLDAVTFERVNRLAPRDGVKLSNLAFDSKGRLIALAREVQTESGLFLAWDAPRLDSPPLEAESPVGNGELAMAPENERFIVIGRDGKLHFFDGMATQKSLQLPGETGKAKSGKFLAADLLAITFSDDQTRIFILDHQMAVKGAITLPCSLVCPVERLGWERDQDRLRYGRVRFTAVTTDGRIFIYAINRWSIHRWAINSAMGAVCLLVGLRLVAQFPKKTRSPKPAGALEPPGDFLVHSTAEVAVPTTKGLDSAFAVIVGVGGNLPETVRDAKAVASQLEHPKRCAFPPGHVRLLTQDSATRDQIVEALDWMADNCRRSEDCTAIIFYSGHGGTDTSTGNDRFFLIPHNSEVDATVIWGDEFAAKIRSIKAKKLLVLLDCCYAAGLAPTKGPSIFRPGVPEDFLHRLKTGSGRVVISSSKRDQISFGGDPYSLFTAMLLQGLAGYGSGEEKGYVQLTDLVSWLGREVPRRSHNLQIPVLDASEMDLDFPIAYYAGGAKKRQKLGWIWRSNASDVQVQPEMLQPPPPQRDIRSAAIGMLRDLDADRLEYLALLLVMPHDELSPTTAPASQRKQEIVAWVRKKKGREKTLYRALTNLQQLDR